MFDKLLDSQTSLKDKWLLAIVLLFPVAGPVVRHWNNLFFLFITVTSLVYLFTRKNVSPLNKHEKIILGLFSLFFINFIVSALINGWTPKQTLELGNELKFLFFVPIYLLVRDNILLQKALLGGVLLSLPIIFAFSLYEYFFILPDLSRANLYGAYFHLFIGPITALMLLLLYPSYCEWFKGHKYIFLLPLFSLMGLFVVVFSQARLAQLTIVGGFLVLLFLLVKSMKVKLIGIAVLIAIIILSFQIKSIQERVVLGGQEVSRYFNSPNDVNNKIRNSSIGLRLELWRTAQYVFNDKPFLGIGSGGYPRYIKKYIDKGLVSDYVANVNQAHNSFFEAFISKGFIGLLLLLLIFYYPVYLAWKYKQNSYNTFIAISIFSTGVTFISLGESMLINKDNGVSYLVIFTAVLFSSLIQKQNKVNGVH